MFKQVIPLLHISNAAAARDFYCNQLGFKLDFAHPGNDALPDPCYTGISREGIGLHLSSFSGDGVAGGVVNILVEDLDALHAEFVAKNVPIEPGHPVEQTWGTREMYVKDTDGNSIRFQQ